MARREGSDLDAPAEEKGIGSDDKRVNSLSGERYESRVYLAAVARPDSHKLDCDCGGRRLQVAHYPVKIGRAGVNQQAAAHGLWNKLVQAASPRGHEAESSSRLRYRLDKRG